MDTSSNQTVPERKHGLLHFIGSLFFGLIVGIVAKLLVPGHDPGGIIITIILGMAGGLVGTYLGRALGWYGPGHPAGFIMSVIGAIVLLVIYHLFAGRHGRSTQNGNTSTSVEKTQMVQAQVANHPLLLAPGKQTASLVG